jgi:hypothetical protein
MAFVGACLQGGNDVARIRTIKPEFNEDELLGKQPIAVRFMFVQCILEADDQGRFRAAPARLKGHCFPYDDSVTCDDIAAWLGILNDIGRVYLYQVTEDHLGVVVNFLKHQRINRPTRSLLPAPPDWIQPFSEPSLSPHGHLTEDSVLEREKEYGPGYGNGSGKGRTRARRETPQAPAVEFEVSLFPDEFIHIFNSWPGHRRGSKMGAQMAWGRALQSAAIAEVMAGADDWLRYFDHADNATFAVSLPKWLDQKRWVERPSEAIRSAGSGAERLVNDFVAEGDEQ